MCSVVGCFFSPPLEIKDVLGELRISVSGAELIRPCTEDGVETGLFGQIFYFYLSSLRYLLVCRVVSVSLRVSPAGQF